jgi:uncharacterized pyridoxal phosphate-containing UPF0001 family protein
MDAQLSFIGDIQRKKIKEFKKKAFSRLDESDRELPQVKKLDKLID